MYGLLGTSEGLFITACAAAALGSQFWVLLLGDAQTELYVGGLMLLLAGARSGPGRGVLEIFERSVDVALQQ